MPYSQDMDVASWAFLAFGVNLTAQPEHDICFFAFSVFFIFWPNSVGVLDFFFPVLWLFEPVKDDRVFRLRAMACFIFLYLRIFWLVIHNTVWAFLLFGILDSYEIFAWLIFWLC